MINNRKKITPINAVHFQPIYFSIQGIKIRKSTIIPGINRPPTKVISAGKKSQQPEKPQIVPLRSWLIGCCKINFSANNRRKKKAQDKYNFKGN